MRCVDIQLSSTQVKIAHEMCVSDKDEGENRVVERKNNLNHDKLRVPNWFTHTEPSNAHT